MTGKQLIVAVEVSAAMGQFWQTILSDYVEKIIRSFCGVDIAGQKPSASKFELSLVKFNAHGSACLVQRSGWTSNVDIFCDWLSSIPFAAGGFSDAAIAEGLAEALMMFSIAPNASQIPPNADSNKHCILIAASNPYPLPTPVYRPLETVEKGEDNEARAECRLSDAEAVAISYAQCAVSLSVICPKQLPKLRAIYNAGKRNTLAADPPVDNVKNPHYLVLVSENFMEARAALCRPGITSFPSNQSPVKMDIGSVPPVSGPPPTNMPLSQQASTSALQPAQSKYVKIWEGNLSARRQGQQAVFITRLEGYRCASASETLAANWPSTMQINRLISQDHMKNKHYVGKTDFLVFRAMNQHGFLGQLQEKKLCAVIQLPSQTLLISASYKACRFLGKLIPGHDVLVFKPQMPTPPQQQQMQQQLQQLQQQVPQMQQQIQQLQHQVPQMQQQLLQLQQQVPQMQQQVQQMQQQVPQMQQQVQQMQQQPQ